MTDDQQKPTLKNLHQQSLQFDLCRDSYQNKSDDARSKGRSLRSIQMEQVAIGISKEYSATETVAKLKHFSAQDVKLMDEAFSKRYRKTTADFLRDKLQKHPKELSEGLNALAKAGVDIYRLK